ncbi:Rho-type gtpase-activating protein [Batrachochytrium dendrobatidis]|nr:Rho-type gtpase-activating protein [Batrachochytrium dendrobatidis]
MPEQPSGTNVSTCKTCGQGFEIGAAIIFKDAQYHSWCFHCSACATKLDPENSLVPSLTAGKLLCQNCVAKCQSCKNCINDSAIIVGNLQYHDTCLYCRKCNLHITDLQYALIGTSIYCFGCYQTQRQAMAVSATSTAARGILFKQQSCQPRLGSISHNTTSLFQPQAEFSRSSSSASISVPTSSSAACESDFSLINFKSDKSIDEDTKTVTSFALPLKSTIISSSDTKINRDATKQNDQISPVSEQQKTIASALVQPVTAEPFNIAISAQQVNIPVPGITIENNNKISPDTIPTIVFPSQEYIYRPTSFEYVNKSETGEFIVSQELVLPNQLTDKVAFQNSLDKNQMDIATLKVSNTSSGLPTRHSFDANSSFNRKNTNMIRSNKSVQEIGAIGSDYESKSSFISEPGDQEKVITSAASSVGFNHPSPLHSISSSPSDNYLVEMNQLKAKLKWEIQLREDAEFKVKKLSGVIDSYHQTISKEKTASDLDSLCAQLTLRRQALRDEVELLQMQADVLSQDVQNSFQKIFGLIQNYNHAACPAQSVDFATHPLKCEVDLLIETFKQDSANLSENRSKLNEEIDRLSQQKSTVEKELEQTKERITAIYTMVTVGGMTASPSASPVHQSSDLNTHRIQRMDTFPISRCSGDVSPVHESPQEAWGTEPFKKRTMLLSPDHKRDTSPTAFSDTSPKGQLPTESKRMQRGRSQTMTGKANEAGKETIKWAKELKNNLVKATNHSVKKPSDLQISQSALDDTMMSGMNASLYSALTIQASPSRSKLGPKNARDIEQVLPYHRFLPHSYISPRKCDLCQEKVWGKELRCDVCGYHCHSKCSASVTGVCSISNMHNQKNKSSMQVFVDTSLVFGVELISLVKQEEVDVPKFVKKCIDYVDRKGISYEGIYRKSGPVTQINRIVSAANKGEDLDFDDEENHIDVTAITSALKQFFRELPDSLICSKFYNSFLDALKKRSGEERDAAFKEILIQLPKEHFVTLSFVMWHLHRVQQNSPINLMVASNLGVVFGPTLLRPAVQDPQLDLIDANSKCGVIEYFVTNTPAFFQI